MTKQDKVDVEGILDSAPFMGLPALVLFCAAMVTVVDGFDIQIIGFAAPALATEFGIERGGLAPALAAALVGMAVGGFLLGPWGDRYGRRPALLASTLLFGLGTLLTALVTNVTELGALRFVTGIGLGGALPNATALMAEFAPPKVRGQAIAAAIVGVPIGGMVGASIAAEIIPMFGWRAIFTVGGVLPLLAALIIYFMLPESPRYLATHPGRGHQLARILNRLVKENRFTGAEQFAIATRTVPTEKPTSSAIFSRSFLRDTLALWLAFTTNVFAVYCFYNWAPTVLTSLQVDLATAVRGSLIFNTSGLIGALIVSWVIARTGSRWVQALLSVTAALAMLYLAHLVSAVEPASHDSSQPIDVNIAAIWIGFAVGGFGILAVQVTMYAVAAHVYPTVCRSAGVGWAVGMARIGGVLSAFGGAFIMAHTGAAGFFVAVAGVLLLTLLGVLLLGRHIPASRNVPAGAATTAAIAQSNRSS